MNIANDRVWAKVSFTIFSISFFLLSLFVFTKDATELQINPYSSQIESNNSQLYFTSGIIQSISEQDRYTYIQIETFCTVSGKYDTLLKPSLTHEIGDFVSIEGTVNTFNGRSVVEIKNIE